MLASRLRLARSAARQCRAMSSMAAPQPEHGILDSLFSRSNMPRVPLDVPMPGLPAVSPTEPTSSSIDISTLENGLRVVSADTNNPIASVGVFVEAGSRYEDVSVSGIAHFLEFFAFKSTKNRSDFRLVREMLKIGANVVCSTSREHTVYAADALREHVPALVSTLADVIQNPAFDNVELNEAREQYIAAAKERENQADVQIMEAIHAAAYHNNTLGLPLYAPAHNVQKFTAETLDAYMKAFCTPQRMVVSGVGVSHSELVDLCSQEFSSLSGGQPAPTEKAQYTGGDIRLVNNEEPLSHIALAFETASWHSPDLVPMCVLQMMMGGGGSFSAGGPGKGMYSRLYQNVLNQHYWVESANCFNSIFTDSSIFGMYGTSAPAQAGNLIDVLCKEMTRMAGAVDSDELSRAKNQLKSSVHMQLESRSLQLEDIGRQLMTYGKIQDPAELCKQIESVSAADIQRVAQAMLKTAPSVAVFGNLSYVPRYDDICKRFG